MGKPKLTFILIIFSLAVTFLAGCDSPQAREAKFLKQADSLIAKQDYARASIELLNASKVMPKDPEPYYRLGLVKLELGRPADAVAAFQTVLRWKPNHLAAKAKLAEMMTLSRDKGDVAAAKTQLTEIVGASPGDRDAADALAFAELRLGNTDESAKRLETTLAQFPAHLHASVALARLKLANHDVAGAESTLKAAAQADPKSSPAALALCFLYLSLGRPSEAEPYAARAAALDPKSGSALATLAAIQAGGGQKQEAGETYRRLSALPDPRYRTAYGEYLFDSGERERAIAVLRDQFQKDPNDHAVRAALITAYLATGNTPPAYEIVNVALKRNPKDLDALIARGRINLKNSKLTEAQSDLQQALHLRNDSIDAHYSLAGVQRALGKPALEQQELSDVLRVNPGELRARLDLARSFTLSGNPDAALDALDHAPPSQKRMTALTVERNWALYAAGKTQEVRRMTEDSAAAAATPELWLQAGLAKSAERDYAGAMQDAKQYLTLRPGDIRGGRLMAGAMAAKNGMPAALAMLKQLVAEHPQSADWNYLFGEWMLRAGDVQGARRAFEAAKAADPNFTGADLAIANLDLSGGAYPSARNYLQAALKTEPRNVAAHLMMAEVLKRQGDKDNAISEYRAVLDLDSINVVALNNLAYALARQDPDAALPYAQRALESHPGNAAVQDTLGWVCYRKGMYQMAVQYLKAAASTEPTGKHEFHLAMAYIKNGDQGQGQALLRAALVKDPSLQKTEIDW